MPAALRDVHTKWRKDLNSMSELKNKTIITVATTGAWPTKANNPNVPMTPEEISEDVYACWKAGAAIAHLHMRDDEGHGTMDKEKFRKTVELLPPSVLKPLYAVCPLPKWESMSTSFSFVFP